MNIVKLGEHLLNLDEVGIVRISAADSGRRVTVITNVRGQITALTASVGLDEAVKILGLNKNTGAQNWKTIDKPKKDEKLPIYQDCFGPARTIRFGDVDSVFRWIPPGELHITWRRPVVIKDGFWMAETECTQELWEEIMGKEANNSAYKGPKLPVDNVSYNLCNKFLVKAGERLHKISTWYLKLPSTLEWEYAARAGEITDVPENLSAWLNHNAQNRPHDVRLLVPNRWGMYDMLGNVWEICGDMEYRGGSWTNDAAGFLSRGTSGPDFSASNLGFRLMIDPDIYQ